MDYEKAKSAAAKLVSAHRYTCNEVYVRLCRKGFDEELAQRVVADFVSAHILNDEDYAASYIHDAVNVHMKGIFRAKQELRQKGIASAVIEKAAEGFSEDETDGLTEYIRLRFSDCEFSDRRELEKAKAHLARRGYNIYDINKAFDALDIRVKRSDFD